MWPAPVQPPHPEIFMSISSPEMAEFAAANRISAGLAVTTVPRATESVSVYRDAARTHGWGAGPEQVLYRAAVHVADSDEEAWADCARFATPDRPVGALSMANPAIDEAVAGAGYYGRDTARQRERIMAERALGAGVLELAFIGPTPDKRRRSLELFGTRVLPRMQEL